MNFDQMVDLVLRTIRKRESGGDYRAKNPYGSASGAYQFIDATWRGLGGGRYAQKAWQATEWQQDEIARQYVKQIYQTYGSWDAVPQVWYVGHVPKNPDYIPGKGNRLTVRQYTDEWMNDLRTGSAGTDATFAGKKSGATAAALGANGLRAGILNTAFTALGVLYKWGGNSLQTGVDCSGLIQQAYKAFGISLPRISNAIANSGDSITEDQLQPGDIVSWDNSSRNRGADHVAIYVGRRNGVAYILEAPGRGKQVRLTQMREKGASFTRIIGSSKAGIDWNKLPSIGQTGGGGYKPDEWDDALEIDAGLGDWGMDSLEPMEPAKTYATEVMPWWRQPPPDRSLEGSLQQ